MSKVASSKNHEVQLAAFLIGRLAAEGVCIGEHKTLIFEAAIEAANELLRQQPAEAEIEKRCALIAEQILDELRRKIDLATKPEGPNIVSPNLGPQHLEELQSIVSAAEIDNRQRDDYREDALAWRDRDRGDVRMRTSNGCRRHRATWINRSAGASPSAQVR